MSEAGKVTRYRAWGLDYHLDKDCEGECVLYADHRAAVKELCEALDNLVMACELPGQHCEVEQAIPHARAVLEKYKEETTR